MLIPQAVLLAALFVFRLLLPVRRGQAANEDIGNALLQTGFFLLSASAAWLVAMILTGYFLPGDEEKLPSARGGRKWPRIPVETWFVGILALPFVLIALLLAAAWASLILHWLWLVQFAAFLLYCIPLFNVFRNKLGQSVLEGIEKARVFKEERQAKLAQERKVKLRRGRLVAQIEEAEREAERLRTSPLGEAVVEDAILQLRLKARDLKQELEILDSPGDE
jgi:hypothetical protein